MQNRIKEQMARLGRQQKELALSMGITPIGLHQIANSKMPKMETFAKVAAALGVAPWELFLTDEELAQIRKAGEAGRATAPAAPSAEPASCPICEYRCPCCGAMLRAVPVAGTGEGCDCGQSS